MTTHKPQVGDRVRVVLEGEVAYVGPDGFRVDESGDSTFLPGDLAVSVEKIAPSPVLPDGLTVSEDGSVLNWLGENYVRQPVEQPVEVFGPGDVVRDRSTREIRALGKNGYVHLGASHWSHPGGTQYTYGIGYAFGLEDFTSDKFERVSLGGDS